MESGNLRDSQCQYAEARTAYDQALRIDPEYADARFDKGETLEKMGKLLEAQKCCSLALNRYNGY